MKKKIHYCWFGGNELSKSTLECIESWKKFFPDYEIIEWNESNFDVNACRYSKEAYEVKKWAFVSDFARFKILMEHGGIYFDTDVEVIRSFDKLVSCGSFMGCEKMSVAPGLGIGFDDNVETKAFFEEILKFYSNIGFIMEDGSYNQKTIVEYTTELLKKHGFVENGKKQKVCGITIYPSDFMCPFDPETHITNITNNTVSIHRYDASWYGERELYIIKVKKRLNIILGRTMANNIAVFMGTLKFDGLKATLGRVIKRIIRL
jgi:glycosyltransferase